MEFLKSVFSWLDQPRNKSVLDGFYLSARIMDKKNFRKEVRQFLSARFLQMYGMGMTSKMLTKCTNEFIKSLGVSFDENSDNLEG